MFQNYKLKNYNFMLLISVLIAMSIGAVIINSANPYFTSRQIPGIIASFFIIVILSLIDYKFVCKFYIVLYIINLILLLAVLLFGKNVNNATRWFTLGGITFQPSELTKVIMIVFVATLLDYYYEKEEINTVKCLGTFAVAIAAPILLILKQPDLSTTLSILGVLAVLIYVSGLSYKIIGFAVLILVPSAAGFIWYVQQPDQKLLYDHQVQRIMSFLYPSEYTDAQQSNSVMAIGSGQLMGKGLNTTGITTVKDANLISEQQTDFIFSVIGEELGFVGSVIIILLLLFIVIQCILIASRAEDMKGRLIAMGVATIIGFQTFINIGVATSFLPNTGIPLPFISYGLSSLMSTAIGIGLVMNVSLQRANY